MRLAFLLVLLVPVALTEVHPPTGEFTPICRVGSGIYNPSKANEIPWFVVDLDKPPQEHYKDVVASYIQEIHAVIDLCKDVAQAYIGSLPLFDFLEILAGDAFQNKLPKVYREEIQGISDVTGVSTADVTLMNMFYELSRFCTSIVAQTVDGQMFHARNLDFGQYFRWNKTSRSWGLTDSLKAITVNIRFIKDGKLLFRGTTFAGHLGVLTAMKPDAFTISMNSRTKADAATLLEWLFTDTNLGDHFAMWAEREVMEQADTYDEAHEFLSTIPQIASCYYILGEGAIIVRNETGVFQEQTINTSPDKWFVLQTNYDIGEVLSSTTNLNKGTVHQVVMSVTTGLYQSFIAHCEDPCWYL